MEEVQEVVEQVQMALSHSMVILALELVALNHVLVHPISSTTILMVKLAVPNIENDNDKAHKRIYTYHMNV